MLRIFIGYDEREAVAFHVLCHSIQRRASIPISITPLNRATLKAVFDRPRGEYESTDFSISRFIVPYLCDYEGWSVFMDCDMLCLGDVAELARYATLMDKYAIAVRCVTHQYEPATDTKFLGQVQTTYGRKNWSSMMLFNNNLCRNLTPEYVNQAPGLDLHQFQWVDERKISALPKAWNCLVGEENQVPTEEAKLLHFTNGGPWFEEYKNTECAAIWDLELVHMTGVQLG
jgi:lipopolysaccharide biosynthesis glycosyltransferase